MIASITITLTWTGFWHWAWVIGEPVGCLVIGFVGGLFYAMAGFQAGIGRAFGWR